MLTGTGRETAASAVFGLQCVLSCLLFMLMGGVWDASRGKGAEGNSGMQHRERPWAKGLHYHLSSSGQRSDF